MPRTFKREEKGNKVIYIPTKKDPYKMDINYLIKLFDETLDDIAKHRKKYPYGEKEYILAGDEREILRNIFKDYKRYISGYILLEREYFIYSYSLYGVFVGMGVGIALAILSGNLWFIPLGMGTGLGIPYIKCKLHLRKLEKRKGSAKYLTIEELLDIRKNKRLI